MPLGIISIFMEQRGTIIMPGICPMPMPGIEDIPMELIMPIPPIIGFIIAAGIIIIMEPIPSEAPEPLVIPRPVIVAVMVWILSVESVWLPTKQLTTGSGVMGPAVQALHTVEAARNMDKDVVHIVRGNGRDRLSYPPALPKLKNLLNL